MKKKKKKNLGRKEESYNGNGKGAAQGNSLLIGDLQRENERKLPTNSRLRSKKKNTTPSEVLIKKVVGGKISSGEEPQGREGAAYDSITQVRGEGVPGIPRAPRRYPLKEALRNKNMCSSTTAGDTDRQLLSHIKEKATKYKRLSTARGKNALAGSITKKTNGAKEEKRCEKTPCHPRFLRRRYAERYYEGDIAPGALLYKKSRKGRSPMKKKRKIAGRRKTSCPRGHVSDTDLSRNNHGLRTSVEEKEAPRKKGRVHVPEGTEEKNQRKNRR